MVMAHADGRGGGGEVRRVSRCFVVGWVMHEPVGDGTVMLTFAGELRVRLEWTARDRTPTRAQRTDRVTDVSYPTRESSPDCVRSGAP